MSDKKPVVLVTRKLPDEVEARLVRDYEARLNPTDALYAADELIERAQGADAIMPCHTEHFDAEMFSRLPGSVQIIANFSVGYDHVDIEAARKAGVVVTNTPDVLSDATAEIVMLLILGAARRASEGEKLVRTATWKDWSPAFMVGTQVTGKTLGIVGLGRVGKVVAKRARGFDMKVIYHDAVRQPEEEEQGAEFYETLEEMLPHCDFLSLNAPNLPSTRDLLNAERIALLPEGAIVVNAARGTLIDEDALIEGLKAGKPAAAGLDVYKNEPGIDPRFRELTNTFLLPHIGSATRETRIAMGFRACDNLDAFFAGKEPRDRVA
ncbi:MAG: D-glycerate dehydrogenase [Methyloligellaceae bacterium]